MAQVDQIFYIEERRKTKGKDGKNRYCLQMSSNHSSLFFPNNKIHCYSTSQICPSVNPTLIASHSIQFPFISDPVRGPFRVSSTDPHTPEEYTFHLQTVRSLFGDIILKTKMKRVSFNSLQSSPEEARIRQRHQRLLQDYLELQKEFVSKKKKLQTAKDKRETLLAEVRFLRRRHGYLQKMQYFKTETENFQHQNSDVQPEISAEERNYSNLNEAVKSSHTRVSETKSILGSIEEKETNKEAIRLQKTPKNCLINGKRVGKKKISVQDQVVLEV